jgi:hypothetical protein
MVQNIKRQTEAAQKISAGDIDTSVEVQSANDVLSISLSNVITTLKELSSETGMLIEAAAAEDFSKRGNADRFKGCYAAVISSQNQLLDEVSKAFDKVKAASGEVRKASESSKKQAKYLQQEVQRLAGNLRKLSRGDLDLDLKYLGGRCQHSRSTRDVREYQSQLKKSSEVASKPD